MSTNSNTYFETKIKPILHYVGSIGACIMAIAYIILMFVLVLGFKVDKELSQGIIFAVVNAAVGFIIMQFLKIQGVDFAKILDSNTPIISEYNEIVVKKASKKKIKTHSMRFFWVKTIITDLFTKILTVAITTAGIIYIVIEGSNDYNMLLLSVVNLLMFACFGLLSLVKAYDFYNNQYIPYIKESIKKYYESEKENENQKDTNKQREENTEGCVEVATSEPVHMEDDTICTDRRGNLLDTSVGTVPNLSTGR